MVSGLFLGDGTMLDDMVRGYLTCALWAGPEDENGEPLDKNRTLKDFSSEAVTSATADCKKFLNENRADLENYYSTVQRDGGDDPLAYAGHDFFLTRNHHGAGFWDRDGIEKSLGERLTKASQGFVESCPYIGDDRRLYFS